MWGEGTVVLAAPGVCSPSLGSGPEPALGSQLLPAPTPGPLGGADSIPAPRQARVPGMVCQSSPQPPIHWQWDNGNQSRECATPLLKPQISRRLRMWCWNSLPSFTARFFILSSFYILFFFFTLTIFSMSIYLIGFLSLSQRDKLYKRQRLRSDLLPAGSWEPKTVPGAQDRQAINILMYECVNFNNFTGW